MLLQFTEKGRAEVKDSPGRAETFRAQAEKVGATVEAQYWTQGEYDGIVIFTAPDDAVASAAALNLSRLGFVRTCLLRAYERDEFTTILERLP
jgi:uncharacterized protein with GYD domain